VVATAQQSRFWLETTENFGGSLDLDLKVSWAFCLVFSFDILEIEEGRKQSH
jgi:hypothetical protein